MVTGRLLLCVSLRLPRPDSEAVVAVINCALSDFCQTMLIFESTKTNTPIQQDLAPILIPPPHMYVHNHGNDDRGNKWRRHKHIQAKANKDKVCETKQNQRYSPVKKKQHNLGVRFEPFPLLKFLSTAGKLLRYLHGSYLLPDHNPSF